VGLLTRFKSDVKLQADALDILTEMILRNLLTASVHISDPACSLCCNILDAYPTGSRDATRGEFRLPPKSDAEVRAQLAATCSARI
jgi:hypothetical protein